MVKNPIPFTNCIVSLRKDARKQLENKSGEEIVNEDINKQFAVK